MAIEDGLTFAQLRELGVGPVDGVPSAFASDDERRRAWRLHQAHVEGLGGYLDSWAAERYGRVKEPEPEEPRQTFAAEWDQVDGEFVQVSGRFEGAP